MSIDAFQGPSNQIHLQTANKQITQTHVVKCQPCNFNQFTSCMGTFTLCTMVTELVFGIKLQSTYV